MSIDKNIHTVKLLPIPDVGEYPTSGMGEGIGKGK
jgi:hypothetical protein